MRCHNAAMGKPFQFSMRRLFIATTLFGVAAALARLAMAMMHAPSYGEICIAYLGIFGALSAFIAGCGAITESEPRKIIRPIAVLLALGLGLFLLTTLGYRSP